MKTHKDLDVWKRSIDFVTLIYKKTKSFPQDELYGITNQMRRSAVSIPSNIAEGASRQSDKEFVRFLYIARGSAIELETQIIIAEKLEYISEGDYKDLIDDVEIIAKMLSGLINYFKNKCS